MKKKYEAPISAMTYFAIADIITVSEDDTGEDIDWPDLNNL